MRGKRFFDFCLLAAAAVCGGIVMAVELLGARMLSVAYGGSLVIWAAVISVTLVSLAAGYFIGGWLSDRFPRSGLLGAILIAAGALLASCPHAGFALVFFYKTIGLIGGALASAAALFSLPLGMLGMASPFIIRLLCAGKGEERVGRIAGSTYAISTLGSVAGTLLTGLWMIPTFGTAAGFRIIAAVTATMGILLLFSKPWVKSCAALAILVALYSLPGPAIATGREYIAPDKDPVKVVAVYESAHGHITILEKGDYKLLVVNGIVQTGVPRQFHKGRGLAERYFQELLPYTVDDSRHASALVIGLAGGMTASMLASYEMDVESVDIDPAVIDAARKYFGFTGRATVADGRRFLEDCNETYSFCVIDTYSGDVFPFHLATREAFAAAKKILRPGGILAINYIGSPTGKAFACLHLTVSRVFKNILALRGEEGDDVQTITLFCSDREILFNKRWQDNALDFAGSSGPDPVTRDIQRLTVTPPNQEGAFVLTDDYNPIDFLRGEEALRWRERTARNIGEGALF
ncbi:MAG: fused MFS/spermidine synthase [Planctomycetota bacterium]